MRWPPNKSWTCFSPVKGFRHFVAINYGGKGSSRWIDMVSVLDSKANIRIAWKDLKNPTLWISGWKQLPKEDSHCLQNKSKDLFDNFSKGIQPCLHPSGDSGLQVPLTDVDIRPWQSID